MKRLAAGVAAILAVVLMAVGIYRFAWPDNPNVDGSIPPQVELSEEEILKRRAAGIDRTEGTPAQSIVVYFTDGLKNGLVLQPVKFLVPKLADPATAVVSELIRGERELQLYSEIPQGTKLLSILRQNGIYEVNFSSELNTMQGSASVESFVATLAYSLTELPDTKGVRILIDGKADLLPHGLDNSPSRIFTREAARNFEIGKLDGSQSDTQIVNYDQFKSLLRRVDPARLQDKDKLRASVEGIGNYIALEYTPSQLQALAANPDNQSYERVLGQFFSSLQVKEDRSEILSRGDGIIWVMTVTKEGYVLKVSLLKRPDYSNIWIIQSVGAL